MTLSILVSIILFIVFYLLYKYFFKKYSHSKSIQILINTAFIISIIGLHYFSGLDMKPLVLIIVFTIIHKLLTYKRP
jgi:hypothetical protein